MSTRHRSPREVANFIYIRECRCDKILKWLRTQPDGATRRRIGCATGIKDQPQREAIGTLLKNGSIKRCTVFAENGAEYDGYRVTSQ